MNNLNATEKLEIAYNFFSDIISFEIKEIIRFQNLDRLKIVFNSGINLFIQYNNHSEYSYSIIFSNADLDRIRFDNYDERWEITTKPHHIHLKFSKNVIESPMIGEPDKDMLLLIEFLKTGKIK